MPLNLRKLRVTKGISQEQLADAADLERRYVGAIERGEENPTVRTLDKLAQALGIHVSEFFIEQGLSSGLIPGLRPGRKASVRRRS